MQENDSCQEEDQAVVAGAGRSDPGRVDRGVTPATTEVKAFCDLVERVAVGSLYLRAVSLTVSGDIQQALAKFLVGLRTRSTVRHYSSGTNVSASIYNGAENTLIENG